MCITSSSFLKPKSLNPSAKEWRPPHLHRPLPPPPPQVVEISSQKLLLWNPHCFYTLPRPFPPIFYHSPPPFSALPPAPPLFCAQGKAAAKLEEKLMSSIVKGGSKLAVPPQSRWEWKPRKTVGCAAAKPAASPLIQAISSRTTVMLRNIPNQFRRDFMLEFLDSYCRAHLLEYDFMYLPMDFRSKDNLGYAFVNFTKGEFALKFKKIVHGYKWGAVQTEKGVYMSKKICAITWARIQGKEKLVKRFESSAFECDDPGFLPVVFDPPRSGTNATPPAIVGRLSHHAMT